MPQKPLAEMADIGYENMNEGDGYILSEVVAFKKAILKDLEEKVSAEDFTKLVAILGSASAEESKGYFLKLIDLIEEVDSLQSSFVALNFDNPKTRDVIEAASLLVLGAAPRVILTSPGPGKYIDVVRFDLFYDFETAAYAAVAGKTLSLEYANGDQLISVATTGVLDQITDQRRSVHHGGEHNIGEDEDLVLKMLGGEVTTGDSPLVVRVEYNILEVLV